MLLASLYYSPSRIGDLKVRLHSIGGVVPGSSMVQALYTAEIIYAFFTVSRT